MAVAACAGCGRAIVWASSPAGARIPLERVATVYFLELDPKNPTIAHATTLTLDDSPPYISHFVSCPKRDEFSKRGRAR